MKKILSVALAFLFLTACSGKDASQSFLDIRAAYLSSDITLSAEVTADYGDRCYEYGLSYTGDGKSGEVSVLSPEEIRGISARIDDNKQVILKCSNVLIDTGVLYGTGVTPVEALPLIVNAIREGYVSAVYTETLNGEEYIVVEIDETPAGESEKTIYTLWFCAENNVLYKAEISSGGFVSVTALFEEI